MKRSEINRAIRTAAAYAAKSGFRLPPFARWSPEEWSEKGREYDEIRRVRLGWDVTDFGKGRFEREGLTLFTIRNGDPGDGESKPYCEKMLFSLEGQVTPTHFHWKKTEDIINRGGGRLVIRLVMADRMDESRSSERVKAVVDGRLQLFDPGEEVVLSPGESITLTPYLYHSFRPEEGSGPVLIGEVSSVNDDERDNRFLEDLPRFPEIDEDEPPERLLCFEYPAPR